MPDQGVADATRFLALGSPARSGPCARHPCRGNPRTDRYSRLHPSHHLACLAETRLVSAERAGFRFYRLAYVLFSLATVVPMILFSKTMDRTPYLVWEGCERVIPAASLTTSALLFLAGGKHYDPAQFLGLRQMITGTS
jgi:hypothetical protein